MADIGDQDIIRFLQQGLSEKDHAVLIAWRKESPQNERKFQELKLLWEKVHLAEPMADISVNKEAAREKLLSNIESSKVFPMRLTPARWMAAAVAVLLIGMGIGYYQFMREAEIIQFITGAHEQREIILPDSSTVWMDENSTFSYPVNFLADTRQVEMEGNLVFEVSPNKEKPFIVQTGNLSVQVLGTKFNVETRSLNNEAAVHVLHGKVKVERSENKQNRNPLILTKGMSAKLDVSQDSLFLNSSFSPNQLFWATQRLVFDKVRIEKVITEIEAAYSVSIELANPKLSNCLFTGSFEDQSVEDVLSVLQLVFDFELTLIAEKSYKITQGISCDY